MLSPQEFERMRIHRREQNEIELLILTALSESKKEHAYVDVIAALSNLLSCYAHDHIKALVSDEIEESDNA